MRYEPATRFLSLSYVRDAAENAELLLDTERRMRSDAGGRPWKRFFMVVGFGMAAGIVTELNRRLLLPAVLGPAETPPLPLLGLQLLPAILLGLASWAIIRRTAAERRRDAITRRLAPELFIDLDIHAGGVAMQAGSLAVEADWSAIRNVMIRKDGIVLECETLVIHIPDRAFGNAREFRAAAAEIGGLWRAALGRERDIRKVAAGLT